MRRTHFRHQPVPRRRAIEAINAAQKQNKIGKLLEAPSTASAASSTTTSSPSTTSPPNSSNASPKPPPPRSAPPVTSRTKSTVKIFESFKKNNVQYFFYIGGNDSADTARITAEMAKSAGIDLHVYHICKTIDNDLRTTDHCPGYGSAGKFVALAHQGDDADNRSLRGIKINCIMGRDAGWLTAASALARVEENDGPHLIYVPEVDFNEDKFIGDVDRVYTKLGRCVIAVSEGIRYKADDKKSLLAEKIMSGGEVDAHGNRQLSGSGALADYLSTLVKDKLGKLVASRGESAKLRVRGDTFGYLQRSFPTIISESDATEARACGRHAVQYALTAPEGLTSGSVAMKRISNDPYKIEFFPTALSNVARQTKHLPTEWIINGNDLSKEYITYAKPLIGPLPKPGKLF